MKRKDERVDRQQLHHLCHQLLLMCRFYILIIILLKEKGFLYLLRLCIPNMCQIRGKTIEHFGNVSVVSSLSYTSALYCYSYMANTKHKRKLLNHIRLHYYYIVIIVTDNTLHIYIYI